MEVINLVNTSLVLTTVNPEPLRPAVPPSVTLGLTVLYTVLYALLFVFVYVQLWLVLHYRHKKLSYQTVFLSLCLLWAALRTTLFSFYFKDCVKANNLDPFLFWLLYCFPVCLQFFTLTLMNLYFAQVVFKGKAKYNPIMHKKLLAARVVFLALSVVFLLVNLTCALLVRIQKTESWAIVLVRVIINDSLFVLCAISLVFFLYNLARTSPTSNIYLEAKGTTMWQTTIVGAVVILLYTSRACYNLATLALETGKGALDYDWYNVSDQADLIKNLGDKGYVVFGIILFIWELLPTAMLVVFFRVRRPPQELTRSGIINGQNFGSRSYFFDNPQQFEDDIGTQWVSSQAENSSLTDNFHDSWYGTTGRSSIDHNWYAHTQTAPLLFNKNIVQDSHHHSLYSTPQT
ncbi:integral membrane protein GPR137 isoform X1 [Protopterus annectens]|uniref:integral membrane protein GPR137 isoform X1 n=2 Tax=Protopterus annectens TaxID=7888 RepID=UPI001CFA3107|nr:integral membrane protein GPR137 isoform X1 [Protopterus annectens]